MAFDTKYADDKFDTLPTPACGLNVKVSVASQENERMLSEVKVRILSPRSSLYLLRLQMLAHM
jgi:hypothetical protein